MNKNWFNSVMIFYEKIISVVNLMKVTEFIFCLSGTSAPVGE
jgi:hypothetical protein